MKIEVLKSEENFLEFVMKGERHTLPNLLKTKLLEDKTVSFASYKLEHPFDSDSIFSIRTTGKKPKKALDEALKEIETELNEFEKGIKKALK